MPEDTDQQDDRRVREPQPWNTHTEFEDKADLWAQMTCAKIIIHMNIVRQTEVLDVGAVIRRHTEDIEQGLMEQRKTEKKLHESQDIQSAIWEYLEANRRKEEAISGLRTSVIGAYLEAWKLLGSKDEGEKEWVQALKRCIGQVSS